jgi:hypothetical protein
MYAATWPGIPIAAWPASARWGTDSDAEYLPPRGHGIAVVSAETPLACWLPIRHGLTPHELRHSHKTWMAEDGIPEILAEQRLGHQVPGMRGLYAHASDRMRDELKQALQARWQESLKDRAAVNPHSPLPLLDELLAPRKTQHHRPAPEVREKMISQIPPKSRNTPPGRRAWKDHEELLTWSGIRSDRVDLVRAYSKRADLCEELVRTLRNLELVLAADEPSGPVSVCSSGRSPRDWRVSDRVSDSEVDTIIMAFSRGTSKRELAERYGISESSVKRLLRSAGVRRRSWSDRLA